MDFNQMEFPFFTLFDPPPSESRRIESPSRTRQEFRQECDINYILARVGAGLDQLPPVDAQYVDASDVPDNYEEMLAVILDANERFAMLPSRLRDRFRNDPVQLLAFLNNPANRAEAEELGLVARRTKDDKPQPSKPSAPVGVVPAVASESTKTQK